MGGIFSGGGGGGSTTRSEIPAWADQAAQQNVMRANQVAGLGYVPYYGLDTAAFTPMQNQAFGITGSAAQAYGLAPQGYDATAGIPRPETAGGFTGYRSGNLFDEALRQLQQRRPAQYTAMQNQFIDPVSGNLNYGFNPQTGAAAGSIPASLLSGGSSSGSGGSGGSSGGFEFDGRQALQNLADFPPVLGLLSPLLGLGQLGARAYVNNQAQTMNAAGGSSTPYLYTGRGFSNDGNTYTTSWGDERSTAKMTPQQIAGLRIASGQNDVRDYVGDVPTDAEVRAAGAATTEKPWQNAKIRSNYKGYIDTWANNGTLNKAGATALAQYMEKNPSTDITLAMNTIRGQKSTDSVKAMYNRINNAMSGGGSGSGSSSSSGGYASAASRSSTALGGTGKAGSSSNVGSRGGNASRGYSSGGW